MVNNDEEELLWQMKKMVESIEATLKEVQRKQKVVGLLLFKLSKNMEKKQIAIHKSKGNELLDGIVKEQESNEEQKIFDDSGENKEEIEMSV